MTRPTHPQDRRPLPGGGEAGSLTIWMLGLLILVLGLGGISLDLWRAFDTRRALAGITDAAAIAGASGIDQAHLRATGTTRLDPDLAYDLAATRLAAHADSIQAPTITIASDGSAITVTATRDVQFTLLRVLLPELGRKQVGARATSSPREGAP